MIYSDLHDHSGVAHLSCHCHLCGVRNGTCLCGMAGYEPHRAHQTAQVGGNDGFNNVNLNRPDFDDHPEPTE